MKGHFKRRVNSEKVLNIIIELSKYLILILSALYTLESFTVFKYEDDYDKQYILRKQLLLIVFMDLQLVFSKSF